MSESTLVDKIKLEATIEVEALEKAAQAEIDQLLLEKERQLTAMREVHETMKEKTLSQLKLVAISKAKQAGKIALQRAKRTQMDDLFATVKKDLQQLSSPDYVAFFARHLAMEVSSGTTIEVVQAPATRLEETKQILAKQGLVGNIIAKEHLRAGLMIYATDGVYDVTLDRILGEKQANIEIVVMKALQS